MRVLQVDFERTAHLEIEADVVVSLEVAEHLQESAADSYMDLLCRLGPRLVLTAATPGQGGTGHVNEQPNEYWIRKLRDRSFLLDESLTRRLRDAWRTGGTADFYHKNLMVFRGPRSGPKTGGGRPGR